MDISALVDVMVQSNNFQVIMNNPLAQFGTPARRYLGMEIFPERTVEANAFVEESIRYRTVIANAGTRYSPVQLKRGVKVGSFEVALGDSDIGSEFTGSEYDALIRALKMYEGPASQPSPQAIMQMTQWADRTQNVPLIEFNEKCVWQCIVDAQVVRTGNNGYVETVNYSNPPGHRVAVGGQWSNNSYDPYGDLISMYDFLKGKGYTVTRQITSTQSMRKFANNLQVRTRLGLVSVLGGVVTGLAGVASLTAINDRFQQDNLPPLETYDLQYLTSTSSKPFLRRDAWVMLCETGRDANIDLADQAPVVLFNTLGYTAIGTPTGQSNPGRVMIATPYRNKPPRVEGEAWQTSLPVNQEPEAVGVLTGIS